jgi:predicted dehydrogenase
MKSVAFGIIGAGLMGREFASAAARWCHLTDLDVRPRIVAVCDKNPALLGWYQANFPALRQATDDYRLLLADAEVEAVYVAVPHHLHEEIYTAAIDAGKHLLGEKPFGIDRPACEKIVARAKSRPDLLVRCAGEFAFFPAVQRIAGMIERGAFGRIIELSTAFLHSSDLDPDKAINWKRMVEYNGRYGVLGDLGMHVCQLPFRAGWRPRNVRAILSKIVAERPDGKGGRAACTTWDNATLLCEADDPAAPQPFPWILKTQRIAPGEKNNWRLEILGTRASVRWSSARADMLEVLEYSGGEQVWGQVQMGYETPFPTVTGGIFQFGFSDAILQMWAAFLFELAAGRPLRRFVGCATPEEAAWSHRLFTAALESHEHRRVVEV